MNRYRGYMLYGGLVGAGFALIIAVYSQVEPRLFPRPGTVFTGAPQGLDEWVYIALCQAVWRSPTQFTYAFPFCVDSPTPPVMLQVPLALLAWVGRVTGLPLAFEVGRVVGSALCGAAMALIGALLCRGRQPRRWFWIATVVGGGWLCWRATVYMIQVSGLWGFAEWYEYLPQGYGILYGWKPYLLMNVDYPLETLYHALVLGAFAALLCGRNGIALLLGLLTWFSNPFPAVALSAVTVPWWAWRVYETRDAQRRMAWTNLAGWLLVSLLGLAYYSVFLNQWPALRELSQRHRVPMAPPLSPLQILLLLGPWVAGIVWSVFTPGGRRHVWGHAGWRLFALLALTQFALIQQGWVLGDRAVQSYHYNRGYMHLGFAAVFWRAAIAWSPSHRRLPPWLMIWIGLTLFDQGLYFMRDLFNGVKVGAIDQNYHAAVMRTRSPSGRIVLVEEGLSAIYLAAVTSNVPYIVPEDEFMPFDARRRRRLDEAAEREDVRFTDLGFRIALVYNGSRYEKALRREGWVETHSDDQIITLEAPAR